MSTSASSATTPAGAVTTSDAAVSPSIAGVARGTAPGSASVRATRPSSPRSACSRARYAASRSSTSTASASEPSAAAIAGSYPGSTCSDSASSPRTPATPEDDERGRAVLLVQRERQRGGARREGALLALASVELLADPLDLGLGLEDGRLRELVRLIEVGLRALAGLGLGLDARELRGRGRAAGGGGLERVRVAQHLPAHGGELRGGRVGLAGERRELEVVRRHAGALARDALVDDVELGARGAGRGRGAVEGGCRVADGAREVVEPGGRLLDHGAGDAGRGIRRLDLGAEQGDALSRERIEGPQPILCRFEGVRRGARGVDVVAEVGGLQPLDPRLVLLELLLQHLALAVALVLAASVLVEGPAQADDLVGEQAGPRVAHDGRDRRRLACHLGLAAERLQLAPDLARQVGQAGQVRLHGVELAEGLLLAAAVLQDPRGLLDEAAPILGARVQHGVELPLADDDVHLPAEARVARAAPARRAAGTSRR